MLLASVKFGECEIWLTRQSGKCEIYLISNPGDMAKQLYELGIEIVFTIYTYQPLYSLDAYLDGMPELEFYILLGFVQPEKSKWSLVFTHGRMIIDTIIHNWYYGIYVGGKYIQGQCQ